MKATDYAKKYGDLIHPSGEEIDKAMETQDPVLAQSLIDRSKKAINDLFIEMSQEVDTICNSRNVKRVEAVQKVILEQNDKWNALCRIFDKQYIHSMIREDGFKAYWYKEMPELRPLVRGGRK